MKRRGGALGAWLFMAPALILVGLFTFYPLLYGLALAFHDCNLLRHTPEGLLEPPRWVGLANFERLLQDRTFWIALKNSLLYLLVVPVLQIASLLVALAVHQPIRGARLFRAAIYVPVITSVVVVGIAWRWVLRSDGLANQLLDALGLDHVLRALGGEGWFPVPWLQDPDLALFSVMLVTLWQGVGYYMILYLAGLQSLPPELEEAARLDGAGSWQVLTRITLPLLKPTAALCTMLSSISALKVFGEIHVMTQGGPSQGSLTVVYAVYERAFQHFEMGYAAAMSWALALVVAAISLLNARAFKEGGLGNYP